MVKLKSTFINDPQLAIFDGKKFKLKDHACDYCGNFTKKKALSIIEDLKIELAELQDKLYAQDRFSLLLVFQAMDAAGKDGTIKHVMSGVNPQGCQVVSFKQPSASDLDHDFIWRVYKELPERGRIGIFNRSHYEEVLVTRVHPEYILNQRLPLVKEVKDLGKSFWQERFASIRQMGKHLTENGTIIIKFFLNVSKEEQKIRFLERIENKEKNWKFSYKDIQERKFWNQYMEAYEDAIKNTATSYAPWFVIPANKNWFMRLAVTGIIVETLRNLKLHYPEMTEQAKVDLEKGKSELISEEE